MPARQRKRAFFASTSYPRSATDWQGLFIRHLAFALERNGLALSVWAPPGERPPGSDDVFVGDDGPWLARLAEDGGVALQLRRRNPVAWLRPLSLLYRLRRAYRQPHAADAYFLNWLQPAMPLPDDGKPVLVTVLGTDMALLRLPGMVSLLRRALRGHPTAICPNAEWMVEPLRRHFGDQCRVEFTPFGIDPRWYGIQRVLRGDGPARWLAVTRLTHGKLGPLFEWAAPLFQGTGRELHLIGPNQQGLEIPPWVHYHGPASSDSLANEWFPSAQGLITLSRHAEGRPQVILEAMAAGLPVVASPLPAHSGVIADGRTGWLVDSPAALALALDEAEDPRRNAAVGAAAKAHVAETVGTWDSAALRYISILESLRAS